MALINRKSAFVYTKDLEQYHYPPDCPFNATRATKARQTLNSMGLLAGSNRSEVSCEAAGRITLKKFHKPRYLHALKKASRGKWDTEAMEMGIGTMDCPAFQGVYEYSALACGATLKAAELINSGQMDVAFNPSGGYHHAGPDFAAGFCYINDVALACQVFSEADKKVLYLDIDVHHGDQVQAAFYDRSDVMTVSFHQDPRVLFPGTGFEDEIGTGTGKGYSVNVPLPIGTYDQAYMFAFNSLVPVLTEAFEPDVIVLEVGADALAGDPLANLHLTNNVYADVINIMLEFNKPILMTGGGGYEVQQTQRAWALAWSVLCGADSEQDMNVGLGGVMLETTAWQGGLRDRVLAVTKQQKQTVMPQVEKSVKKIKDAIFKYHDI